MRMPKKAERRKRPGRKQESGVQERPGKRQENGVREV